MSSESQSRAQLCNCLALRQAARQVTQLYDRHLASAGLRTTQFSILARLKRLGPMTINRLALDMVMDRTTLGRNILPLERDGLIAIRQGTADKRSKELELTPAGTERLRQAAKSWAKAQQQFEAQFGAERAATLRAELRDVASIGSRQ
ncbi:MAG: MarR family winged helix-turn-helix transcriptional regulator [Burkholderiales bacterium]